MVKIWSDILKVEQVGIHDNFFELGGNSLLGAQVISRLRVAFSIDLSLHRLFISPTVAELAHNIEVLRIATEDEDTLMTDTEEYEEGCL